ncbi:TRAP transporter small permease subunit [Xanthobacteraceae bacterium Astr-EGSB]|uniref:TRAP transporter small permease subunit n=1 Tax=Astrobacterium formosum TaxID=3069710 RepID=UPI0027B6A6B9|nr:TRAP transporter small permease subunit [Xanthobacteraceae bacterium Astr-EGSB]
MSPLNRLAVLASLIDRANSALGRTVAWCALVMVLVQVAVVGMRYVLGLGSLWLTEAIIYAHATLFLMAAAWTLQAGGHVRVDIVYARARPRTKAWIDLLGALAFLLPFAAMLAWLSLPYVGRSWVILERSREASGLPLVYALKTLIPLFAISLGLQGVAQAIRAGLVLIASAEEHGR